MDILKSLCEILSSLQKDKLVCENRVHFIRQNLYLPYQYGQKQENELCSNAGFPMLFGDPDQLVQQDSADLLSDKPLRSTRC